ncbi:hypothetical protein RR48_08632 [Papilio machaon]|uniref:Uncharacterized protein n=1 Tax=Papilio machaon TaxID=76193 RepID=A0A194R7L1_PAPMA|nr:hypothetical protein RR48_08632 [Papilio machaon]
MKTTTIVPYFKWRTNGTTKTVPKTQSPRLYDIIGIETVTTQGYTGNVTCPTFYYPTTSPTDTKSQNSTSDSNNSTSASGTGAGTGGEGRKHDLRYGFHKVADCESFEQSFLCIQKCVDLNYDVAHADKHCKCTCFIKKDKEKYKSVSAATRTRWRSGAPKTSIPPWAGGQPVVEKDTVPEINTLNSSDEEELKSNSTNSSNGEEILKDQVTGGDVSNSTAATDSSTSIANGDVTTNGANEVTTDTSSSTTVVEEDATEAP